MPKVCWAGIPLRSLIKATSGNTMPLLSPMGWGIIQHEINKIHKTMDLSKDFHKISERKRNKKGCTQTDFWQRF